MSTVPPRPPASSSQAKDTVSIAAVAARAKVSIATVSRVLNGVSSKFSPTTQQRVMQAVAELGYRPTVAGRALRSGQSRLVAVLASNLGNPSMAAIAAAAEVALRKAGYVMVLCDTHDQPELQDEYLLEMGSHYARGLVLLGAVDSPQLGRLAQRSSQMVFVNRRSPVPLSEARYVGIDNMAAVKTVAEWMVEHCRGRFGLIHGDVRSSATRERVDGFLDSCRKLGVPLAQSYIRSSVGLSHLEIGFAGMQALMALKKPPIAVFCTSDLIAYGAHRQLREHYPAQLDRVALVGFDHSPLNSWIAPWLNGVRVPYGEYGDAILRAMQSEQPQDILLPYQWVTAASSGQT